MFNKQQNLELLPALQLLLHERHVSRAADKMSLSQSAMSRILAKLRDQFDDLLLVRSGSEYLLTPKGEALHQQLNLLLPQLEQLWQSQDFCPSEVSQTISLSGADLDVILLAERFKVIGREAPKLELVLRNAAMNSFDLLLSGKLDFVLSVKDDPRAGLHRKVSREERFVAIVDANNQITQQQFTLDYYLSQAHGTAIFSEVPKLKGIVDQALAELGVERTISLKLPSFSQIPPFLAGSPLIFTLPLGFANYLAHQYPIKLLELPFNIPLTKLYLYWHQRHQQSPLHQWLRETILN